MRYVTLSEARAHVNLTDNKHDDELAAFLATAEEAVADRIRDRGVSTQVETLPVVNGTVLLGYPPASAVASVVSTGGVITSYTLDRTGQLLRVTPAWSRATVTVTYTSGLVTSSDLIRTTVLMALSRLWETQRGGQVRRVGGGDDTFTPGMQGILREVEALLGSRVRTTSGVA